MTEGFDDRPEGTEEGQEDQAGGDWDQPWPGEVENEGEDTFEGDAQETSGSTTPTSPSQRATPRDTDTVQEQPGKPAPSGDSVTANSTTGGEVDSEVEITDSVKVDDTWIDLSGTVPSGEILAAGDLSEEQREQYTTGRRSLHPLVQVHWGIRVTIGAVIVGLIATWGLGSLGINQQFGGVLVGLFVLLGLTWVVLYYRLWVYEIRTDAIYLERGVVTHVRTLVPYVRIQHVDTSQSPIERMLGLSTLVVYTAGSRGADVSIPGLQPEEARDLQRRVKELAIEAEGDDAL